MKKSEVKKSYLHTVFEYETVDSTNNVARSYVTECKTPPPVPAIFIADMQTSGRGRMGRNFYSPSGTGLYMSILIEAPDSTDRLISLTSLCAVAAFEALSCQFGIRTKIKWVNDLYIGQKKIAGILAESFEAFGKRYIVVGVGINLSTRDFPVELRDKAGSVELDGITHKDRLRLALDISENLLVYMQADDISHIMDIYRNNSCVIGKRITFVRNGKPENALAVGVSDLGALTVMLDSGELQELSTGEISIRITEHI